MLGRVAHVERRQAREAAHEQTRAREHDDRERDLRCDEQSGEPSAAVCPSVPERVSDAKRRRQIEAQRRERRQQRRTAAPSRR